MAVMTDAQRKSVWEEWMRQLSNEHDSTGTLTKTDARAAFDAIDDWVSDNSASFNAAIPTAAKNALSTPQKVRLLLFVISKRYEVGT